MLIFIVLFITATLLIKLVICGQGFCLELVVNLKYERMDLFFFVILLLGGWLQDSFFGRVEVTLEFWTCCMEDMIVKLNN